VGDPTGFRELNALLADFVARVSSILGEDLVGVYLVGSFALGGGDVASDCDFLVVTERRVDAEQERALRELHDEIPTRDGYWPHNLEGSYAPKADLESLEALGRQWLFVNRGHRDVDWDGHDNAEDVRWVLRERGLRVSGPPAREFTAEVPASLLRERARSLIASFVPDLREWANFEVAWTQRYAVQTLSRLLYTVEKGEVTTKLRALEWALGALAPEWRALIEQARDDRFLPWDDPPRPGSMDEALAFAGYAREESRCVSLTGTGRTESRSEPRSRPR
jgi:predicted nucleotidyltransferase